MSIFTLLVKNYQKMQKSQQKACTFLQYVVKNLCYLIRRAIFRPHCLFCEEKLSIEFSAICPECIYFFELIDPFSRCTLCFCDSHVYYDCPNAIQQRTLKIANCFYASSYIKRYIELYTQHNLLGISTQLAAFAAIQFITLTWPIPNAICIISNTHTNSCTYFEKQLAYEFIRFFPNSHISIIFEKSLQKSLLLHQHVLILSLICTRELEDKLSLLCQYHTHTKFFLLNIMENTALSNIT